jgi:hypothetical protein
MAMMRRRRRMTMMVRRTAMITMTNLINLK